MECKEVCGFGKCLAGPQGPTHRGLALCLRGGLCPRGLPPKERGPPSLEYSWAPLSHALLSLSRLRHSAPRFRHTADVPAPQTSLPVAAWQGEAMAPKGSSRNQPSPSKLFPPVVLLLR